MKALSHTAGSDSRTSEASKAVAAIKAPSARPKFKAVHQAPVNFRPGQTLPLSISVISATSGGGSVAVIMHYRHVNQAERWQQAATSHEGGNAYKAEIDGSYTQSVYPLQYYFELRTSEENVTLYPGFNAELNNQPYFVVQAS